MSNYPGNKLKETPEGYPQPSAPAYNPNYVRPEPIIIPVNQRYDGFIYPPTIGRHGRRVVYVDELDYVRQQQRLREERQNKGFWQCLAATFCCLFCCFPFPN